MSFLYTKHPVTARRTRTFFAISLATVSVALLTTGQSVQANTPDNVTSTTANTPLDSGSSYSGGLPGTTSDVTFTAGTAYSGTFTDNTTALSIGTLNDLSTTKSPAISNSQLITLNGGSNSVAPSTSDLLYVVSGGNLGISGTGGIAIAASGNFDVAGTATISSALTGLATSGTSTLTLTGAGTGTLGTGVINNGSGGGTLGITDSSTGTWTLSGASSATTSSTYASGTNSITLGAIPSGLANGDTILGNGITAGTTIIGISGTTLTLSTMTTAASNTSGVQYTGFSGGFTLNSGALIVGNNAALGTGALTINGGTLEVSGGSTVAITLGTNNAITWGGNFAFGQAGANTNHSLSFGTGAVSLAGTSTALTVTVGASSPASLANTNIFGLLVPGVISKGATTTTLVKAGSGAIYLDNNSNSFSNLQVTGGAAFDTTSVTGGGTYGTAVSEGTPFGTGDITLNGGTIGFNTGVSSGSTPGYTELANNIDLTGNGVVNPGGGTKREAIFNGLISGSGQLTLTTTAGVASAQTSAFLSSTNTYTGGTNLDNTGSGTSEGATPGSVIYVANALNALGGGGSGIGGVVTFVNNSAAASQNPTYLVLTANQTIAGLASSTTNTLGSTFVTGYGSASAPTLTINSTSGGTGDGSNYAGSIGGTNPLALTFSSASTTISTTTGAGNLINVAKTGTGTQILSGLSSYTGTTAVNGGILNLTAAGSNSGTVITAGTLGGATAISASTGGTLLLGANYTVNPSSTASLGGGTISLSNGVLQGQGATVSGGTASGTSLAGFGALTLTAKSTVNFAGASGTLVFSSFTPAGFTLDVDGSNFGTSTTSADSSTDRLIFAADQSGNLADFTFNGTADASEVNLGGGFFEIEPSAVPEPSTVLGGLLVVGSLGWSQRRRVRGWMRLMRVG